MRRNAGGGRPQAGRPSAAAEGRGEAPVRASARERSISSHARRRYWARVTCGSDRSGSAKKGGEAVSEDRKHMSEIGKKGGEAVSEDRSHMSEIGKKGGEAVSEDREHMADIGKKGGLA